MLQENNKTCRKKHRNPIRFMFVKKMNNRNIGIWRRPEIFKRLLTLETPKIIILKRQNKNEET